MKSWKKQWKDELKQSTPKLRSDVENQPINVVAERNNVNAPSPTPATRRKPFWYGLSAAAAVLIVVALCVTLIPSGGNNVYAFVVEINPAVTVSADSNGNVTGIISSNADADVILSDYQAVNALKGKPVDEVVKWYVDKAAQLGYLDEDNPSAVRISTVSNGNKLLDRISGSLESYFMERGVKSFVVTDVVDLPVLSERANVSANKNVKEIAEYAQSSEPVFRSRDINNLSKDELQQTYKNYASFDALVQGVGNYLNGIIDLIEQNEKDIFALRELNKQIEEHEGNPALMLKDYWSVKTFYSSFDDAQFAELMSQMDEAVESYNETYGSDINSSWDLDAVSRAYSVVSAKDLRALLEHFSADVLKTYSDWLSDIIQTVSPNASLVGLTALPETAAEFVNKMRDVLTIERASREKEFEQTYNKVREQLSQSDYNAFKQNLLSEYGSADEVWNNLK